MSNYYDVTGAPAASSFGSSAIIRAEFQAIEDGISDKLPPLTGNGDEIVKVNAGGTALESITVAALTALIASSGFIVDDANASSVIDALTITHTTTGTPAAGIGTGLAFVTETAAGNNEIIMTLDAVTTDVSSASEDADLVVNLMAAGATAAEKFRVTSTGNIVTQGTGITLTNATAVTGTWSNLGTVTTVDINGGTIDGAVIGGSSAAAGSFTTLSASTSITGTLATAAQPNVTSLGTLTSLTVDNITINGAAITSDTDAISFADENLTTTGTLAAGATTITGNATVSGALFAGTTSMTASADADNLLVGSTSGNNGLTIQSVSTGTGNIYFSDTNTIGVASREGQIVYNHSTGAMSFATAQTTAVTIDSSQHVGIGIASPDGTLHVHTATAGTVTANASADDLVVESSGFGGISILGTDASSTAVYFGSPSDNVGAVLDWNYNSAQLRLASHVVGSSLVLRGDNNVANLTLSGASGSELATFAGTVSLSGSATVASVSTGSAELILDNNDSGGKQYNILSSGTGYGNAGSFVIYDQTAGAERFRINTSGDSTFNDGTVKNLNLLDYGEVTNAIGSIGGGTQDIDLTLGNSVSATVDTSTTTFTFSNPTASGQLCGFTLVLTNGGSQTVNWPASVDWASGTAPTLTASGVDVLTFLTLDGGTTWYGAAAIINAS